MKQYRINYSLFFYYRMRGDQETERAKTNSNTKIQRFNLLYMHAIIILNPSLHIGEQRNEGIIVENKSHGYFLISFSTYLCFNVNK